ncbi:MAG: SPASM domain-containing protein [Chloroflexota bacterium]|nr:MAG: SPASM domain-containing protein [Chloroflexota bacterium]
MPNYLRFLVSENCLDFPLVVQIQTQSFCNGRCSICPYPVVSRKLSQGAMDDELFSKIARELASEPLFSNLILHLHNEPLLDAKIFERVRYLKSISKGKNCNFVTNGVLLDKFSLTEIKESNIDRLTISLNAHSRETYESTNIGLDYDRVMSNIDRLISDKFLKQRLVLGFVLTQHNAAEIYQATQYWKRRGVKTRVLPIFSRGGLVKDFERLKPDGQYWGWPLVSAVWHQLVYKIPAIVGCHRPFSDMCILYNGDIILCCQDWNRSPVLGNVAKNSLKEIWNSDKMRQVRRLLWRRRYSEIDACKDCSIV